MCLSGLERAERGWGEVTGLKGCWLDKFLALDRFAGLTWNKIYRIMLGYAINNGGLWLSLTKLRGLTANFKSGYCDSELFNVNSG